MSTNDISLVTGPETIETLLIATTATAHLDLTTRVTKLEEERREILNKVSVAKRLAAKCILNRMGLEENFQKMVDLFKEQQQQHNRNLDHVVSKWRSELEDLLHRCQENQEDKMRETLMCDVLSDRIDKLQDLKYGSLSDRIM
jgi:DNA-binding transcriptional regulator YbjK